MADASAQAQKAAEEAKANNQVSTVEYLYVLKLYCLCQVFLIGHFVSCSQKPSFDNLFALLFYCSSFLPALFQAVLVLSAEIGADGKVAKKLQEQLRAVHPSGSFFIASLDDDAEK